MPDEKIEEMPVVDGEEAGGETRTAGEVGWHVSRYNISANVPDSKNVVIANLYKANCAVYTPIELYLLSVIDELDEHHPIIDRFAKRGIIANFDERAALEVMGRGSCARPGGVGLTICPTMGCNFDCPYCFEDHGRGKMSAEVQDDVVALTERMLDASCSKALQVTWFGGEPLLALDVVEALSQRLIALAEERGAEYMASVITNGYLMDREAVDVLERCKIKSAQITLDGMGAAHDATRHLAGGGATFDRIIANLRAGKLPFEVNIRHNVHEDNLDEVDALKAFVEELAEETGSKLRYYPSPVTGSAVADERGKQVGLLCGQDATTIGIKREAGRFSVGRGSYCGAHTIWAVGIDDAGNLQKCWEAVDKPELSFGTAHDWDPKDPFGTASNVDNLTKYLNTAIPVPDEECSECIWLPTCVGGCPYKRLFDERECVAFKDDPEAYALALYERLVEQKAKKAAKEAAEADAGAEDAESADKAAADATAEGAEG